MTPLQLKDMFRADVRDEAQPYLWSDMEIYGYMDDAQKVFCRLGGGIADSTSAICRIPVTAGVAYVDYDPRILKMRSLHLVSNGRNIPLMNFEDVESRIPDRPGPVHCVILGMDADKMRLVNVPTEDDELQAIVYRLPLEDITDTSTSFEIDSQHHRHLMDWMKYLALSKQDAETYDKGRAEEYKVRFWQYCDSAKWEREKREHKYRTVAYGGI